MYPRNAIIRLILPYKHRRLLHTIKFHSDAITALFQREYVNKSYFGSKLSSLRSVHNTDDKMIKLTPLSGLRFTEGSEEKNTEITDTSNNSTTLSNEKMGKVAKPSILPTKLLNNVEKIVKNQVGIGEFSNVDPDLLIKEKAFTLNDNRKEPTSEMLTSDHNESLQEENEDSMTNNNTNSDVYDISVLFSGTTNYHPQTKYGQEKFDKAYKKSIKKAVQKSGKKRKKDYVQQEEDGECDADEVKKKKPKKVMPNYFVAVQVTNSKIHEELRNVQQSIQEQMPSLTAAMIPLPTLHLTLLVMHLANEEEVQKAKTVLKHCGRRLSNIRERPIILGVSGIGHFGNNVVFAKVVQDSNLDLLNTIANVVDETFRENEVHLAGEKGFKPHITIMKLSRSPKLRKKGIKKIDSKYYSHYAEATFGNQTIESLQLCSMMAPKDKDGYYQVVYSVPLGKTIGDEASENVFTAQMEKEVVWNFAAGPTPEPVEPTEEEKKRLLDSENVKMGLNEDPLKSKLKTARPLTKVPQRKFQLSSATKMPNSIS